MGSGLGLLLLLLGAPYSRLVERTGEGGNGGLEAVHARAGAELARRRDCTSGGATEDVPVAMSVGCLAFESIDVMERTWWRKGMENYRLCGECREMQSPVNDKPAISAWKRRKTRMK